MQKFEIEFEQITKMIIEAEDINEADDIASMMDGEEIAEQDTHEYSIFNIREMKD